MDSQFELQQPIVDGGIRSVNFFNGRMLTARDLTREQNANREMDRRMGQALGEGIAYGFEVSAPADKTPVLTVEPGLAINRQGQTLWLPDQTQVTLVRKASASTAATTFGECKDLQSGTYIAGAGIYLFTVAPAETREGRAVTNALNAGGVSCNTDTLVSGLQFRLIQIDLPLTAAELNDVNRLRNLIAYKCFGVTDTQSFVKDPFGPELSNYGLLDTLRPNRLTDCDVPLGVLYWTLSGGIKFVDMWSVRRRLTRRSSAGHWKQCVDERRVRESEAMFLQFQDQIDSLRRGPAPVLVKAKEHFYHLPPVGMIPLAGLKGSSGFDLSTFFEGLTYRHPVYIEGAKFQYLMRSFLSYAPVDLKSEEMLWLYQVRENIESIDKEEVLTARPYLIFTSGHVPYQGDARFNLSHWDYANYALDMA